MDKQLDPLNHPRDAEAFDDPEYWRHRNPAHKGALHPKLAMELIYRLRRRIDNVDDKITALFDANPHLKVGRPMKEQIAERSNLVLEITAIKREQHWPLYDERRESEIRNRLMLIGRSERAIDLLMSMIRDGREANEKVYGEQ